MKKPRRRFVFGALIGLTLMATVALLWYLGSDRREVLRLIQELEQSDTEEKTEIQMSQLRAMGADAVDPLLDLVRTPEHSKIRWQIDDALPDWAPDALRLEEWYMEPYLAAHALGRLAPADQRLAYERIGEWMRQSTNRMGNVGIAVGSTLR